MENYPAPALAKGLDILDLVRNHHDLSFNELQTLTKNNPSSLNRYIKTLLAKKYLYKNKNQKYELGIKMIDVMSNENIWGGLIRLAKPHMVKINKRFGITVLLIGYSHDDYIVLDKVIHPDNLGMMPIGCVNPNKVDDFWFSQYYTVSSNPSGIDLFQFAQQNGYVEQYSQKCHILRIGYPIFNDRHVVLATLGVGTFEGLVSENDLSLLKDDLNEITAMLSDHFSKQS